jgi:hypothetical protein
MTEFWILGEGDGRCALLQKEIFFDYSQVHLLTRVLIFRCCRSPERTEETKADESSSRHDQTTSFGEC